MNKTLFRWILSGIGMTLAAFSLFLVFQIEATATCSIIQTCPNGGSVSCAGVACQHTQTSVTCTQDNGTKITEKCQSDELE